MTAIDPKAPILVTGASGYIANWIVRKLLEQGRTVHATVRNPGNAASTGPLENLAKGLPGKLKLFAADLLKQGSFDAAAQGCELVMHTASPFLIGDFKDPNETLVRPALEGTRNVLGSVERTSSVKRVVLTSSVAAIYGDSRESRSVANGTFTENQWNTTSSVDHNPYPYSKMVAEREAWRLCNAQQRWDMVTIHPSFVFGPALTKNSQSYSIETLTRFGDGRYRFVPRLQYGCVDVRDVAEAHVLAGLTPSAKGRYIVSAKELWMFEMGKILRKAFGSRYPLPFQETPKFVVWLVGPIVAGVSRDFVKANVGYPVRFDGSRVTRELGLSYRPVEQTLKEHFQQLLDDGVLKKR